MTMIERMSKGQCLAAQADEVNAAIRDVLSAAHDMTIVLRGPDVYPWAVQISSLTPGTVSVMPCGSDGCPRDSRCKPKRESGYLVWSSDLDREPRKAEAAAQKIIGRSHLIHSHDAA